MSKWVGIGLLVLVAFIVLAWVGVLLDPSMMNDFRAPQPVGVER